MGAARRVLPSVVAVHKDVDVLADQPALEALLERCIGHDEIEVALALIPSLDLTGHGMLARLATHEDFFLAEAVADEIATLEAADEAEGLAELRQQLTAEKAARTASEAREKVLAQRVDRIEQKERVLILGDKIKACKVPAFRPGLEALYAYALEHGDARVKVYSTDKDGKTQTADSALTDVIDGVVAEINRKSEQLFKALAYSGAPRRVEGVPEDENPSIEIEKRVREFRGKHPEVKQYVVGLKAVMAADAELAQRYRDQVARGATPH